MGGFLPALSGLNSTNDLTESKTLNLVHRHVEIYPDGRKVSLERTQEEINTSYCKGTDWLIAKGSSWDGKRDRPEDHFREDKKVIITRQTKTTENPDGTKIIDEIAGKKEDFFSSHGTKLISDNPEIPFDNRDSKIQNFLTTDNPLTLLGAGKGFIPLLGGDHA
jgi:hypothetical protein